MAVGHRYINSRRFYPVSRSVFQRRVTLNSRLHDGSAGKPCRAMSDEPEKKNISALRKRGISVDGARWARLRKWKDETFRGTLTRLECARSEPLTRYLVHVRLVRIFEIVPHTRFNNVCAPARVGTYKVNYSY